MLNQKQFGCLKILSVIFILSKIFFCLQSKHFPPDKRHPGHRSRYGKYGPRSGYGFLRTACQPIRIENFEKSYNKLFYFFIEPSPRMKFLSKLILPLAVSVSSFLIPRQDHQFLPVVYKMPSVENLRPTFSV
jgi:hypothetical protein